MTRNLGNNEWILNETYSSGLDRIQTPHPYQIRSNRRIILGSFAVPRSYEGEWRRDTHSRLSRIECFVCIDSPRTGEGRQLRLIDIQHVSL